jgi:uncharacterized protein YxjI
MPAFTFPITFLFKISTLANDFTATDAQGQTVAYVRQKLFKLKEAITVYADETKGQVLFQIQADRWLDFSAAYTFTDRQGVELGKIVRQGWASLWKAHYEVIDPQQQVQYRIQEEKPWVKVMDSLLGEVPILGMLTGYLFNPAYQVTNQQGEVVARIVKLPSLFGRRFEVSQLAAFGQDDGERILLSLMMMVLLERRRG